jgi:hypothetical protein
MSQCIPIQHNNFKKRLHVAVEKDLVSEITSPELQSLVCFSLAVSQGKSLNLSEFNLLIYRLDEFY